MAHSQVGSPPACARRPAGAHPAAPMEGVSLGPSQSGTRNGRSGPTLVDPGRPPLEALRSAGPRAPTGNGGGRTPCRPVLLTEQGANPLVEGRCRPAGTGPQGGSRRAWPGGGQGERRIVAALLVRDRRLAGHAQRVGQPGLRPAPRAAPGRDVVAHLSAPAAQGGVAHRELEDDERLGTLDGAADRVVPQPGLPNSTYRTWVMTPLR